MVGEGLGVALQVAVVPAADVDAFDFEDVVDGPGDAQEAADHNQYDFEGEAEGGVAGGTRRQVGRHALVDLKHAI